MGVSGMQLVNSSKSAPDTALHLRASSRSVIASDTADCDVRAGTTLKY